MKLNKLFFILLSVVVLAGFSSCGSDDDDYSAKDIEGRWHSAETKTIVNTSNARATEWLNAIFAKFDAEDDSQIYEFKTDGTYLDFYYPSDPNPETGTYRVHGRKLYLKESGESTEFMSVISFPSKDKLKLSMSGNLNVDLLTYITEDLELGTSTIELMTGVLEVVGVDIATVKMKSIKRDMTYAKIASPR